MNIQQRNIWVGKIVHMLYQEEDTPGKASAPKRLKTTLMQSKVPQVWRTMNVETDQMWDLRINSANGLSKGTSLTGQIFRQCM